MEYRKLIKKLSPYKTMGKSRIERLYSRRAETYDESVGGAYNGALQRFVRNFPFGSPTNIFEAGCGTGVITQALTERFPESKITGLDQAEEMLKQLDKKMPFRNNIELIIGDFNNPEIFVGFPDGERASVRNNHYDLFISVGALTEYGNLQVAMPWAYHLLKRNGRLVLLPSKPGIRTAVTSKIWFYKPKKKEGVLAACVSAGFSDVIAEPIGEEYGIIAKMKYLVTAAK